ncbi:uncharacterized protein LOC100501331 [Zea mays]|jgi:hypothetical protein|uniref:Uncharacterized protein n=1 Tax=Zea mays TaxID=4577 RepID=C4J2M0_MAIZE|nr:uncharacterized protein LOC100501331 [Zea mays]ACR35420.1 unknown [Zea mays]|eukprot:NP_001183011.1 uncharacterized protein LOC100501331 [Zea mays]
MEPTLPLRFHCMREIFMSSVATTIPHRTAPRRQGSARTSPVPSAPTVRAMHNKAMRRAARLGHARCVCLPTQGHAAHAQGGPCRLPTRSHAASPPDMAPAAASPWPHVPRCTSARVRHDPGQSNGHGTAVASPWPLATKRSPARTDHGAGQPRLRAVEPQCGQAPAAERPGRRAPRRGHAAAVPRLGRGQLPAWARTLGRQRVDA